MRANLLCEMAKQNTLTDFLIVRDAGVLCSVFYRAGFIENWGQGIQKICDECQGIGAELPVYELIGTTLRIYFRALEGALIDQHKTPNRQCGGLNGGLADKILALIRANNTITVLETPKRIVEREIKKLRDNKRIMRKGGNRYGHWKIND